MPKVGKKSFPYTKAGEKKAKMEAKKTGKKMVSRMPVKGKMMSKKKKK